MTVPSSAKSSKKRILEELSFSASEAENGRDALDRCRMSMPDAVLLDWNMPVMDGIAFLVALRKEQGGEAPKVIFCTTENDVEHITPPFRPAPTNTS
jgi:two-component system, chemotaxis family, chemotaxis protein CheY